MPEWIWGIMLFVGSSLAYWAGVALGRSDRAPSEHAWINVRKYSIDAQKETSLASLQAAHEEQMVLIERGVFDAEEEKGGCPPEEENDD